MKEIIVIRHGEKRGDELTPEGIVACKVLASRIDKLNYVYASDAHRAYQTAELVSLLPVSIDPRANIPSFPNTVINRLIEVQKVHPLGIIGAIWEDDSLIEVARDAGLKMKDMIDDIMNQLGDGERALIVSHDGTMVALEKVLKNESFDSVDHSFGSLEGFRLNQDLDTKPFRI
jgi:broad specificity phosphatase PhoE